MKRIAMAGVVAVVVLASTAYFSARMGYKEGLADSPGLIRSPDAAYIVAVLDRIHAGDTALAATMLESHLDLCLVDRWAYDRRRHRFSSILRPAETAAIPALIGVGAQHRANNPSADTTDKVKNALAEVVSKYESLAPRQRLPN